MLISLHKQATTTLKVRAAIQASAEPAWMVGERYGVTEQTDTQPVVEPEPALLWLCCRHPQPLLLPYPLDPHQFQRPTHLRSNAFMGR